jgi:hypothetical protein
MAAAASTFAGCAVLIGMLVARGPSQTDQAIAAEQFTEIRWDNLVPKDWDPVKRFLTLNRGAMDDSDMQGQRLMRAVWDNAPTVSAMDDTAVRLPGYVVPLEEVKGELSEFLLVPYFGACIHSPPPAANQIVHVRALRPVKGVRSMDTVWVSGRLTTARQESSMGMSGYQIYAVRVDAYSAFKPPPAASASFQTGGSR